MADLHGHEQDVEFDWAGANSLVAKFEATAGALDGQIPRRNSYAENAREEWRGTYSRTFVERMNICTSDARHLSHSMRDGARKLRELARLAREEQERREKAREWAARQHDGLLGAVEDVGSKLGLVDKEELPPVDYGEGHRFTAKPHMPPSRG